MDEAILAYIKNEKDIARYNLKILGARDFSRPSIRRLVEIEKEFIRTSFEKMRFETVADAATAIAIYRKSRQEFYKTYKVIKIQEQLNKTRLLSVLSEKKERLLRLSEVILWDKIESINPVQDEGVFEELVEHEASRRESSYSKVFAELEGLSLPGLLEIEPVKICKKRARLQIILFSIFLYLHKVISEIPKLDDEASALDIDQAIRFLDNQIDIIEEKYLGFYNISIDILENNLENSLGKNEYIHRMHKLINILDFEEFPSDSIFIGSDENKFEKPEVRNLISSKNPITYSVVKDKDKNIQNKTFGILLPIDRKGNELMTLMYKEIFFNKTNISNLFCNSISNVKVKKDEEICYHKAILIRPIWQIYKEKNSLGFIKLFSKILNLEEESIIDRGILAEDFKTDLNHATNFTIDISPSSKILVPKTRSEENAFKKVLNKADEIILGIKKEYYRVKPEDIDAI